MNDIEDRFAAAAGALLRKFPDDSVPSLRLPEGPPREAAPGRDGWSRARGWLVPLAAAVAVIAVVAASLAVVRGLGRTAPGRPAPHRAAASPEGTPPYYVNLRPRGRHQLMDALVTSTATGRVLAAVKAPPPYTNFTMVSGAADDRTFALAADTYARSAPPDLPTQFFLLRFNPKTRTARLTRLPVHLAGDMTISALALSPDGTRLALFLPQVVRPKAGKPRIAGEQITVFYLATGASRTWTNERGVDVAPGFLSWSRDGRTLEYVWENGDLIVRQYGVLTSPSYVSLLDTNAPGRRLPPGTRFIPPRNEYSQVFTPDGTLVVATVRKTATWGISEYSRTLRPAHHLGPVTPPGSANSILWTNASGSLMIVRPNPPGTQMGILGHGRYLRLPGRSAVNPYLMAW